MDRRQVPSILWKKRIGNKLEDIQRSDNHHAPIIDRDTFDLVQEIKKTRTNIELDEHEKKSVRAPITAWNGSETRLKN